MAYVHDRIGGEYQSGDYLAEGDADSESASPLKRMDLERMRQAHAHLSDEEFEALAHHRDQD